MKRDSAALAFLGLQGFVQLKLDSTSVTTVGRGSGSTIQLAADTVSRSHYVVRFDRQHWYLENMSQFGTRIARETEPAKPFVHGKLHGGDRIVSGLVLALFLTEADYGPLGDELSPRDGLRPVTTVTPSGRVSPDAVPTFKGAGTPETSPTKGEIQILTPMCEAVLRGDVIPSNEQLAAQLMLTVDGVRGPLRRLYAKFGVPDDLTSAQRKSLLVNRALLRGVGLPSVVS